MLYFCKCEIICSKYYRIYYTISDILAFQNKTTLTI